MRIESIQGAAQEKPVDVPAGRTRPDGDARSPAGAAAGAAAGERRAAGPRLREMSVTLDALAEDHGVKVSLAIDPLTEQVVFRVSDPDSGEIIRQIPSEEALALEHRLDELRQRVFGIPGR